MTPKRITPYLTGLSQKNDGENSLVEGNLCCCNSHEFKISFNGALHRNIFSNIYVAPENDRLALVAQCKKCGDSIQVFDSTIDGYEKSISSIIEKEQLLSCKKCGNNNYSLHIKYEYPDMKELIELGIEAPDTAFTWIWISLECNCCGTKYKNFIDYDAT